MSSLARRTSSLLLALALIAGGEPRARAHCDTMDGPVVAAARRALERRDPAPALWWVTPEQEGAVREAFAKTLAARGGAPAAREVADTWFFETLVRLHRAGEGESYTGLLPAGSPVEPGIRDAERALESGSADELVGSLSAAISEGIHARLRRVREARERSEKDVASGRAFVAAYVEYVHYVERLHAAVAGGDERTAHQEYAAPHAPK